MMPRFYIGYCVLLIAMLAGANARGYVLASLFTAGGHSVPGQHYHK